MLNIAAAIALAGIVISDAYRAVHKPNREPDLFTALVVLFLIIRIFA